MLQFLFALQRRTRRQHGVACRARSVVAQFFGSSLFGSSLRSCVSHDPSSLCLANARNGSGMAEENLRGLVLLQKLAAPVRRIAVMQYSTRIPCVRSSLGVAAS